MCNIIKKHYKVFILLTIIILSIIILIYLSFNSKKSSNNPPKEDITIDVNKPDEIKIEEEVTKQVDTNDELEEVSNEDNTNEIKNDSQVINNKSNIQKISNTTSNSEQKNNTEVVSTPNNQEEHYEENNNQVNDFNNENVNNNYQVENNTYISVPDPNNFFYSIHHGKIEYADLQSCLDESYNILFKDTEDITNTTCIDVVDSQGTILGEYMQIKCHSGNCDKYKN